MVIFLYFLAPLNVQKMQIQLFNSVFFFFFFFFFFPPPNIVCSLLVISFDVVHYNYLPHFHSHGSTTFARSCLHPLHNSCSASLVNQMN